MAYYITDRCVKCGVCVDTCPAKIITRDGDKYYINPDLCFQCGFCADACPLGAIELP